MVPYCPLPCPAVATVVMAAAVDMAAANCRYARAVAGAVAVTLAAAETGGATTWR